MSFAGARPGESEFLFNVLFGFGEDFAKRGISIRFATTGEDQVDFVGSSAELVEQVPDQAVATLRGIRFSDHHYQCCRFGYSTVISKVLSPGAPSL